MIRIFLPLILAAVAAFGPWADGLRGVDFADPTIGCLLDLQPSITGICAPGGDLGEKLIAYTVLGGAGAAVLSVIGLLPVIGRLTSLVVVGAGLVGLAAGGMTVFEAASGGGAGLGSVGWGAWASIAAGLLTAFVGVGGLRGEDE